ncbi:MAG: hypothetical protein H6813_07460 [Phycisphaeraceae bacterium]|nr:hypothetical protein [Phycisphaeraceae bacterium]MCB9848332.1 hypothetical protein [Phycisphaeraceae bacterium]
MSVTIKPDVTPHEVWENRFEIPTMEALTGPYQKPMLELFETARQRLGEFEGASHELSWQGPSWKWCLTYQRPGDATDAWAYLVPHPDFVIIAIPLKVELATSFPMRRLKRFVRDGLAAGHRTGDTLWPWWAINNKTSLEDVLDIIKRKNRYVTALAAAATAAAS